MAKIQFSVTLEPEYIKYLKGIADEQFEGNMSMAIRKVVAEHSKTR